MKLSSRILGIRQTLGRQCLCWLAALVVSGCLQTGFAQAQRRPPTIPNTSGGVTIRSSVGGPNAISINLGGGQFQSLPRTPPPVTFGPAISLPSQPPARIFYVYHRNSPEFPWVCYGGYRSESQAQQSVLWFRQTGNDAFYR